MRGRNNNERPIARRAPKYTEFFVTEPAELMDFLMKKMSGISRNKVKSLLTNRVVLVDNVITTQYNFALKPGMKVVVIEDLISTGGSSLKAVQAIRNNGCEVIGMVASYTYGFDVAEKAFKEADVELITLTNYEAVLEVALETGYITEDELPLLNEWRRDPSHWNQ